jgi:hypothetical protein
VAGVLGQNLPVELFGDDQIAILMMTESFCEQRINGWGRLMKDATRQFLFSAALLAIHEEARKFMSLFLMKNGASLRSRKFVQREQVEPNTSFHEELSAFI